MRRSIDANGRGALLLLVLLLTACASEEDLYRDVAAARADAARAFAETRATGTEDLPVLSGDLSLEDAAKLSLLHNKKLNAVVTGREAAAGRLMEARAGALPSLVATGSYRHANDITRLDAGPVSFSEGALDTYAAGLAIRQPVYRGGAIAARIRAARLGSLMADEEVRGAIQETLYTVVSDYLEVLLARELYAANRDAVTSAAAMLSDAEKKKDQGVASDFDVLRARVDLSNFRAEMIQQQNRIHLAKTRLLKAMGVSPESAVKLSGDLTYEPMRPVLEEAVRVAMTNRPDLYRAELDVRIEEQALRIAKSRYLPQIDASLAIDWGRPDPLAPLSTGSWGNVKTFGLSGVWTLFDGFGREGRIRTERANLARKEYSRLDAREQAFLEVKQALLSLADAEEFVDSQKLVVDEAKEALRLVTVGYREGTNVEVEVTEARSAVTRARSLYYRAVYSHEMARIMLQRAMGILGPRAGESTRPEDVRITPGRIEEFEPKPGK